MKLEEEIENLNKMLIKMADVVESNLKLAISLYEGFSEEKASLINDDIVDLHERLIEEMCMSIMLKERPYAKDMRNVIGILKLVEDLERLGDHAEDIVTFTNKLNSCPKHELKDLNKLIDASMDMVHTSIESFIKKDLNMASETIKKDDVVDALYDQLVEEIISLDNQHLIDSSFAIYTTLVVKYLERIADHASNIAEWVIYILNGYHKDKQIF
jgi:phosphate transport system protein